MKPRNFSIVNFIAAEALYPLLTSAEKECISCAFSLQRESTWEAMYYCTTSIAFILVYFYSFQFAIFSHHRAVGTICFDRTTTKKLHHTIHKIPCSRCVKRKRRLECRLSLFSFIRLCGFSIKYERRDFCICYAYVNKRILESPAFIGWKFYLVEGRENTSASFDIDKDIQRMHLKCRGMRQRSSQQAVGIFFDPDDGGDMFYRDVGWRSSVYTALYPRIQNSS
jgi:hypothetical protein